MSAAYKSLVPPGTGWVTSRGSGRLSRRRLHACPLELHRRGWDSVGLCKRGRFNLLLPLFLHKYVVTREKLPFVYVGGRYVDSPRLLLKQAGPKPAAER